MRAETVSEDLRLSASPITTLFLIAGVGVLLLGLLVSPAQLVELLRDVPPGSHPEIELGALCFKVGLVLLGIITIGLSMLPIWQRTALHQQPKDASSNKSGIILLIPIVLVATGLRLHQLDAGLWFDEILTYVSYARLSFGEIVTTYDSQNQHFLFSLLAHAAILIFGDSASSLRLPAALFGVGSIWATYLLGKEVGSVREGLLSAALLTVSYHHIWFSQNARGYSGLLFWTVVASWLMVRAIREGRPHLWVLYSIAAALGMYTHMTMLFVIAAHGLMYLGQLFVRPSSERRVQWALGLMIGFGLTGFLTLLLHALVLPQILFGHAVGEVSTVPDWNNPLWTLLEIGRSLQISPPGLIIVIAAISIFGLGIWSYARTEPLMIQLLLIPTALCTVSVLGVGHPLWPRFFFFAMSFAVLVLIRGILCVAKNTATRLRLRALAPSTVGTGVVVGLILLSAVTVPFAFRPKQDFTGALAYVESRREPGDAVVVAGLAALPYRDLYRADWQEVETADALNVVRASAHRTWFVYTISAHLQAVYPELMSNVHREFELMTRLDGTVGDGAVWIYRADGSAKATSQTSPRRESIGVAMFTCETSIGAGIPCPP
ncbi:MAG: glycosyltransferase family 39 protein [Chloroflexota bacterium]